MPQYRVTLSDGRRVLVEADQPPTEAQILAQLGTQQAAPAQPPAAAPTDRDRLRQMIAEGGAQERVEKRESLPTLGGMVGSALGGPLGAMLGGAGGEAFRQLDRRMTGADAPTTPTEAASDIATSGAVQGALEMGGKLITGLGKLAYKGGAALLPKTLKQQYPDIAQTGFREGVALTRRGARKAEGLVSASRQQADDMIAAAEQAGAPPVRPREVVGEFRPVAGRMKNQAALGKADETPALAQRARTFARRNRGGIPLTQAQALKREAQDLANTAYKARDRGAVINQMEALTDEAQARGLRKAIEARVPGVGPVNARTQSLMGVQRGAEHSAETGHILSRLGGAGAAGVMGLGAGAVPALGAAAAGSMLTTPGGLSRLGLVLKRTGAGAPDAMRLAMLLQQLGGGE